MASLPKQEGGAFALPPIPEPAHRILGMLDRLGPWTRASTIEALILRLDAEDMATEDMEDDDPAGGNAEDEGESDDTLHIHPRYGLNQTRGPVNHSAAKRANHLREIGRIA